MCIRDSTSAAEVMDIDLLDHIILARDAWQSMAQLGLLDPNADPG